MAGVKKATTARSAKKSPERSASSAKETKAKPPKKAPARKARAKKSAGKRVPLSILDLCPRSEGTIPTEALDASLKLAQVADRYGYNRYWAAEHHGSQVFMASATAQILTRAAERTRNIRVGAGGVMMPNHVPLLVAEAYGTLASMYPGRVDLGIGRAPGTDPITAAALRRGSAELHNYAEEVAEVIGYLEEASADEPVSLSGAEAGAIGIEYRPQNPVTRVRALPGQGTKVPIWMLGSSTGGARVAGALGLPYSFASHFAPAMAKEALQVYRDNFDPNAPTAQVPEPYVMGGVVVMCAPSVEEADYLLSSTHLLNVNMHNGIAGGLPEPVEDISKVLSPEELEFATTKAGLIARGTPEMVVEQLEGIVAEYGFDELIIITHAHDPLLRRRSFQLLARAWGIANIYPEEDL